MRLSIALPCGVLAPEGAPGCGLVPWESCCGFA